MNKAKKVALSLALVSASAITFVGCSSSSANMVANAATLSSQRTSQALLVGEDISTKDLKIPELIGTDFFQTEKSTSSVLDKVAPNSFYNADKNGKINAAALCLAPAEDFMQEINYGGTNYTYNNEYNNADYTNRNTLTDSEYKARFYNKEDLTSSRGTIDEYVQRLNDLYLLTADLYAAQEEFADAKQDVKNQSKMIMVNASKVKEAQKDLTEEQYNQFKEYNTNLINSADKLRQSRSIVKKELRQLPSNTNDYVASQSLYNRYLTILNKMEEKINLLNQVKIDAEKLNNFMASINGSQAELTPLVKTVQPAQQTTDANNNLKTYIPTTNLQDNNAVDKDAQMQTKTNTNKTQSKSIMTEQQRQQRKENTRRRIEKIKEKRAEIETENGTSTKANFENYNARAKLNEKPKFRYGSMQNDNRISKYQTIDKQKIDEKKTDDKEQTEEKTMPTPTSQTQPNNILPKIN